MAQGAVHHHLINEKLRMSVALIVETGEARWVLRLSEGLAKLFLVYVVISIKIIFESKCHFLAYLMYVSY